MVLLFYFRFGHELESPVNGSPMDTMSDFPGDESLLHFHLRLVQKPKDHQEYVHPNPPPAMMNLKVKRENRVSMYVVFAEM